MPRWLTTVGLRFRSLFRGHRVERELDEELQYHLEREIEERLAAGLTLDEARHAARRSMGAIAQNMEVCRDLRRVTLIEHRMQDLRFALRQLRKHPGFAATAVSMLALGLCANVAIFGFVDAALIRPLPYQDPLRLVTAFGTRPDLAPSQRRGYVSYLNFLDWRARNRAFTSIAAYGAWQTRFDARPDVLGQIVLLQGEPHVVIGVLPRDFYFPMAEQADFWATIRGPQACWELRGCRSLETVARLSDGVSVPTATADLDTIVQHLRSEYPDPNPATAELVPLRDAVLGDVRPIMLMLLSGAGLLLLIACINVVSLLLARSDSRTREVAVGMWLEQWPVGEHQMGLWLLDGDHVPLL
jgi:macrolide transport system ATP-binding/permease protein